MAFPFLSPTTGKGATMQDLLGERVQEAERIKHHAMQENRTLQTNSSRVRQKNRSRSQIDRHRLRTTISNDTEPTSSRSQSPILIPKRPRQAWQSYFRPKTKSEKSDAQMAQYGSSSPSSQDDEWRQGLEDELVEQPDRSEQGTYYCIDYGNHYGNREALSPSDFPPTSLFRACAGVLTTPLGRDFVLDPLKLNSPTALFSAIMPTEILNTHPKPVMILDIGGSETDPYAACLAEMFGIHLQMAVLQIPSTGFHHKPITKGVKNRNNAAAFTTQNQIAVRAMEDLTRLPYPDSSIHAISARSLHKGVRCSTHRWNNSQHVHLSKEKRDIKACLLECSRVLVTGGYLEYIYFENNLVDVGPVTARLEYYLWEVWNGGYICSDAQIDLTTVSRTSPAVSAAEFSDLLRQSGFRGGGRTVTQFPILTLSELFDHRGDKRNVPAAEAQGATVTNFKSYFQQRLRKRFSQDKEAEKLLAMILQECHSRNTGWKCVVGWAVKSETF